MSMDDFFGRWEDATRRSREYRLIDLADDLYEKAGALSVILDARPRPTGPIRLGRGARPKKGPPPAPSSKRAKVKAARKANVRRAR